MLRAVTIVFVLLFQVPVVPTLQQQTPKASIEGLVVRSVTGQPLDRARVTLQRIQPPPTGPVAGPVTPPPPVSPMQTEKDGKFSFKDLDPGQYRLRVQRNGYAGQEYGQRTATTPGTVINLTEGQQLKDIAFRLTAASIVTGQIRDSSGEAVPGLLVSLMRSTYTVTGQRNLTNVGTATTDDRGEYRIYWVPPAATSSA